MRNDFILVETLQNLFVTNSVVYFILVGKTSLNNLQKSANIASLLLNGLIILTSFLAIVLAARALKKVG